MPAPLDFYFEFASPYGYLASLRIDAIAAAYDREVTWRPIMLGAALKLTGGGPNMNLPLKGPYLLHDAPRFARYSDGACPVQRRNARVNALGCENPSEKVMSVIDRRGSSM